MRVKIMWYVVDLLFAQQPEEGQFKVMCESCNVLFEAPSAVEACRKAMSWAKEHSEDAGFALVGIQHVQGLEEERPGDGSEIGGSFHEEIDPWGRKAELIPNLREIPIFRWEGNPDRPIKDLMTDEQVEFFKKIFGED
jgi:hypothetical protein